jgi:acetyl esterase/lipase
LIYVHGGGWLYGDKKDQGLPLCNHLATLGWVCFNINYRLSPGATWPDHLVDAKAAIAWVREHAADYGIDPGFIAIAGGSAGAQIAAMAALTHGEEHLQPGFGDEDTSVQAVVTSYGVYDLTNRLGAHNPEFVSKMIGPLVVKAEFDKEPEKFASASPRDHTGKASVPWLVIHGSADELAPAVEARDFFDALSKSSSAMCGYAEFPGASHAFDIYYCHRANAAVDLTARFLATARSSSNEA